MVKPEMTIRELQDETSAWQEHNFPDTSPHRPLLGVAEELGELAEALDGADSQHVVELSKAVGRLAHSRLKREQGIRVGEDHVKDAQDAVADIMIFLVNLCSLEGWDAQQIVMDVWAKVSKRDWTKNKVDAGRSEIDNTTSTAQEVTLRGH